VLIVSIVVWILIFVGIVHPADPFHLNKEKKSPLWERVLAGLISPIVIGLLLKYLGFVFTWVGKFLLLPLSLF
jgi:hypothetical protein